MCVFFSAEGFRSRASRTREQVLSHWAASLAHVFLLLLPNTAESIATQTRFELCFLGVCTLQVMWQIVVDVQDTW